MGRPPNHPSGAKIHLGFRLPPAYLEALDRYAEEKELSRNGALELMFQRAFPHLKPQDPS